MLFRSEGLLITALLHRKGGDLGLRLRELKDRFILVLEARSAGREVDVPTDTGCTITLFSGKHGDHLLNAQPEVRYEKLPEPLKVSNAEEGKSLYAVAIMQGPVAFQDEGGEWVENYYAGLLSRGWPGTSCSVNTTLRRLMSSPNMPSVA